MSHKGNKLITLPQEVKITINKNDVVVKGPLGELKINYPSEIIKIQQIDNKLKVTRNNNEKQTKMLHGTVNANLNNAVVGVKTGYKKILKIVGVGYKAKIEQEKLVLAIGYSHLVPISIPKILNVVCPSPTQIEISGYDKTTVGEFAAKIRSLKKPEPYKGKGIMYLNEQIIRKVGKTAEVATGASSTPTKGKK
ncbi:50S ribosomal protein L6 [bacterium]|nr:50S ribosomal protein L6 [bacterium]